MTRFFTGMLVVGTAAVTAACSSSSYGTSSSAEATDPPAVCSSADALQASMSDLGDVQVVENGTAAISDAVTSVRSALTDVMDDAGTQYATQVDDLQASFDEVQAAVKALGDAPSAASLTAVTTSVTGMAGEVSSFADDVASTC